MSKVFISAGHGGSDPGAVANGVKEKDLNLSIALACKDMLEKYGVSVKMSRTKDEDDPVGEEVKECNSYAPSLAISIHCNAGGGNGGEVFYTHLGGKGKTLAENILAEMVNIGQNSRGIKTRVNSQGKDYYAFIRNTSCPAVIVECAFVDNASDLQILVTESQRKSMGEAVAKGILKTLGVENQSEKATLYRVQVGAYSVKANAEAMEKKLKALGIDAFIVRG